MNQEFWWNWWIQFAVAMGTIGAVVTALWAAMRQPDRPLLKLKILRDEGERTFLNSGEDVRNYHLKVWNEHRSTSLATRVQVYLTPLEESTNLTATFGLCGKGICRSVGVIKSLFLASRNSAALRTPIFAWYESRAAFLSYRSSCRTT